MRIKPFKALRPTPENAAMVASVPYDTVNAQEARALAAGNPMSFLRVVKPEIDLPDSGDTCPDDVFRKAEDNFREFREESYLVRESQECLYVYRQQMGEHVQRGIVACCHIEDYERNVIRKHEKTRQDKENERARHVSVLSANTGPVFLTYRDSAAIDEMVAAVELNEPLFDFSAPDGIRHSVWRVEGADRLVEEFSGVPTCYIADGHHRTAAAARTGIERRSANPDHTGEEEYNWFLAVLFPANQLSILPYNRFVSDLNGMSETDFLNTVKKEFGVKENASPSPASACSISMYLGGKWYGLEFHASAAADPVSALDVSYLQDRLLAPALGIEDPRTDKRIEFIGGIRGTGKLVKRVDSADAAVAFSMYPVTVDQMMRIADADCIMPPKSTWFEPKLRSGLLVHTL
jgi:uncharacterized protein (DUF1015 family)